MTSGIESRGFAQSDGVSFPNHSIGRSAFGIFDH